MSFPRRTFLVQGAAFLASAGFVTSPRAQGAQLTENDPQAVALGYVLDTTKANQAKYPGHTAAQMCGNCQLYQGKAGDAMGPCPIYSNKLVVAKGWCSAYSKKP